MDKRTQNTLIFKDSIQLMNENERLQRAVEASIINQKLYLEKDEIDVPNGKATECETVISTKRSLEAAAFYAKVGRKTCVLNFASATNPGGGVTRGSSAQEECLCRCSTLYPCLNTERMWQQYYKMHRKAGNPLYNDDCIYTPEVLVFKRDISLPERMPEEEWYPVDVITCAAPNLRKKPSNSMNPMAGSKAADIEENDLYQLYLRRIERIFKVAATNGTEVLILGAFGCGAFCNPPQLVAGAFKEIQEKYATCFEVIEYAIFCGKRKTQNYDAFCEVFK